MITNLLTIDIILTEVELGKGAVKNSLLVKKKTF